MNDDRACYNLSLNKFVIAVDDKLMYRFMLML